MLDRIDLHVEVPPVKFREISGDTHRRNLGRKSASAWWPRGSGSRRVSRTSRRSPATRGWAPKELKEFCALDEATKELLKNAMADYNLSARAYDRILKVARTIADLAGAERMSARSCRRGDPTALAGPAVVGLTC